MSGLVRYPIQLGHWIDDSDGIHQLALPRVAQLDLPSDLTHRDVDRIVAMMRTLVVERDNERRESATPINAVDPCDGSTPVGPCA